MADLNRVLDYNLIDKKPSITPRAQGKIDGHIIVCKDDWEDSFCKEFISETKKYYSRRQGKKCAYCRITINPDGSGNALEHITPRVLKPYWMFVLHNLVVACDNCNSSKGINNVLSKDDKTYGNLPGNCPTNKNDYYIFNPHCDKWSEHFEIEDKYFIKPISGTKGPYTYKRCGMSRYIIIVDYLYEEKVREPHSFRILNQRIRKEKNPEKLKALSEALNYFKDIIDNN